MKRLFTTEAQRHREGQKAIEQCLCHELNLRGLSFARQVEIPVAYKGVKLDCGYCADVVVANEVILNPKIDASRPPADIAAHDCKPN